MNWTEREVKKAAIKEDESRLKKACDEWIERLNAHPFMIQIHEEKRQILKNRKPGEFGFGSMEDVKRRNALYEVALADTIAMYGERPDMIGMKR